MKTNRSKPARINHIRDHSRWCDASLRGRFIALLACSFSLSGAAIAQGVIEARLSVGEKVTDLRYSRQGDIVRIEETRTTPPAPPVTLLNVKTDDATIYFRHNSTFIQIPAARLSPK